MSNEHDQHATQQLSRELESEIEIARGEHDEDRLTRGEAIIQLMKDMDDKGSPAYAYRKELQDLGIKLGIFKRITHEEMNRVQVSSGKKYDFKRGGVCYVFDSFAPLTDHN